MPDSTVREYTVNAATTDTFGRVLTSARNQHLVVDGPVQNGCPGEAITPAELFLAGVATCGAELVQVIAKAEAVPLRSVAVTIRGVMDRAKPVRPDVTLFNSVDIRFMMKGVSDQQARTLVEAFKGR
jgi:Predicted redox protein, regulator of disulfide bond formation